MTTPIADFIDNYIKSDMSRLHMPGHKGKGFPDDITEIKGADSLYEADGIIAESEKNATAVFGSKHTFYSAEGSSQCIKAMLMSAVTNRMNKSARPIVLAARNVHKAFVHSAALIDFDVEWLLPDSTDSICSCFITAEQLKLKLQTIKTKPCAVYITSPDYLGNMADIKGFSEVCKEFEIPLLVDNAHGAYLKFTGQHPIDLGADMCCDSAHKTLPVLTGGAYLHINNEKYLNHIKETMAVFGSTSPSYLILKSLDNANRYMAENFESELQKCIEKVNKLKVYIKSIDAEDLSAEPLKITLCAENIGYTGYEVGEILRRQKVECEYCDERFAVMMFTPNNNNEDFDRVENALKSLKPKEKIVSKHLILPEIEQVLSIREAYFSPQEEVTAESALNRICGFSTVSCPPAVPIAISGEKITPRHIALFKKYSVDKIKVVINETCN